MSSTNNIYRTCVPSSCMWEMMLILNMAVKKEMGQWGGKCGELAEEQTNR